MLDAYFQNAPSRDNVNNPKIVATYISKDMEDSNAVSKAIIGNIVGDITDFVHARDFLAKASELYAAKNIDDYDLNCLLDSFRNIAPEATVDLIKFMHSYIVAKSAYMANKAERIIDQILEEFIIEDEEIDDDDSNCDCKEASECCGTDSDLTFSNPLFDDIDCHNEEKDIEDRNCD